MFDMSCLKTKNLELKTPRAFTLVELIVSMTIFTIFVGVVTSTFLLTSRALREADEVRKVYGEARLLMDQLTQDVRLNAVDYACLNTGQTYQTIRFAECDERAVFLPLISGDGAHRTIYRFEDNVFSILKLDWNETGQRWDLASGFTGFEPFDVQSVILETIEFTVVPAKSPTEHFSDNTLQFQPSVHVLIEAKSRSGRFGESIPVRLETTISSRLYQ